MKSTPAELEKIAALPLVADAIKAQAEAEEAEALAARIAALDAHQQASDALAAHNAKAAELDALREELESQREALARQRTAHAIEVQRIDNQQRAHTRELRDKHGSGFVLAISRMLASQADALRREATYQRAIRDRKEHWSGTVYELPSPEATRRAEDLERRAEQIERARDAVLALQFARISPQAIERDIQARVKGLGFTLNIATDEQAGWRIERWGRPKTRD